MEPIHLIEMNEGMMVSGIILALSFIGIFTETRPRVFACQSCNAWSTDDAGRWTILWFLQP